MLSTCWMLSVSKAQVSGTQGRPFRSISPLAFSSTGLSAQLRLLFFVHLVELRVLSKPVSVPPAGFSVAKFPPSLCQCRYVS